MAKTRDRVRDSAGTAKPYVERALYDEDLRKNVTNAFASARNVYNELIGNRGLVTTASRVATDKDIQDQLKSAVDELRSAADRLQGKKQRAGRNSTLVIVGIALGILALNPSTRNWIADKVFGGGDDFTYESSNGG
jgi:hypothetical protein